MGIKMDALALKYDRHRKEAHSPCGYNPMLLCEGPGKRCIKCGWNPRIQKERKTRIREERRRLEEKSGRE